MPVQINEVIVRAVVNPPVSSGASQADCAPAGNAGTEPEVVEKVLEIIREKRER